MQMKWFVFHICNISTQIRSGQEESKEVVSGSGPMAPSKWPHVLFGRRTRLPLLLHNGVKGRYTNGESRRTGNPCSESKSYICKFKGFFDRFRGRKQEKTRVKGNDFANISSCLFEALITRD